MRIFIFILSICFLLYTKQNMLGAARHQVSTLNTSKKNCLQKIQQKSPNQNRLSIIMDELDVEDEHICEAVAKNENSSKDFNIRNGFIHTSYSTNSHPQTAEYLNRYFIKSQIFETNSAPIYIMNRSLII